jgi:hypothetical protein
MLKIVYLVGLLLLVNTAPQTLFAATSSTPAQIAHVTAHYDVLKGSIKVATMTETFTRTHDNYHIESVTQAVGLLAVFKPEVIHVTSEGTLTAKGLRPVTYIQERKLDTVRNTRADFDWKSKLITLTDHAGKRTVPLPAGTQDRLSAMYQFMFTSLQKASELSFNMTNGSKMDDYSYHITPDQSMTVPLGTFKALYVANPLQNGNQTEIWLATEHNNFPYKMAITDKGDQFTQVLTQINFE